MDLLFQKYRNSSHDLGLLNILSGLTSLNNKTLICQMKNLILPELKDDMLMYCYSNGILVETNFRLVKEMLKNNKYYEIFHKKDNLMKLKLADAKNNVHHYQDLIYPRAKYKLAKLYYPENQYKGFKYYLETASSNHPRAQYQVGLCYKDGLGVGRNQKRSLYYFKLSANNGYFKAQHMLGKSYIDENLDLAVYWLKKCDAKYDLAKAYEKYNFLSEAYFYFLESAELNYPPAQYKMGELTGELKWYWKSWEQDYFPAGRKLLCLYSKLNTPFLMDCKFEQLFIRIYYEINNLYKNPDNTFPFYNEEEYQGICTRMFAYIQLRKILGRDLSKIIRSYLKV